MHFFIDRIRRRLARRGVDWARPISRAGLLGGLIAATLGLAAQGDASPDRAELARIAAESQARFEVNQVAARLYAAANNMPMEWTLPGGARAWLVGVDGNRPIIYTTRDRVAAITVTADAVWPGGALGLNITGRNQTIGVWDDGLPVTPELEGRVRAGDGVSFPGGHATLVAGAAASTGINPAARGLAYEALIDAYSSSNDNAEMAAAAAEGLKVSNHSYGFVNGWVAGGLGDGLWAWFGTASLSESIDANFGYYSSFAAAYDRIAFAAPNYLVTIAVGNQRGDGPANQPVEHWARDNNGNWQRVSNVSREVNGGATGFDCLPSDSLGKNVLIVGAVRKITGGYRQPSDVVAASFTCWGPRDDGGIKPDLVAPGVSIFGPAVGGGYESADGTSFAAPIAAGAGALLRQHYETVRGNSPALTSAMLRGLMCHTANEAGPDTGPDYMFGWGLLNVRGAAELITRSEFEPGTFTSLRLAQGQTFDIPITIGGTGESRITIAWNDPAANARTLALNDRTSVLVNDIDMRLIRASDQTTYLPYRLDPANPSAAATKADNSVDNIEQIRETDLEDGAYTLRISHKGPSLAPNGSADVAVIITTPVSDAIRSLVLRPSRVTGGREDSVGTISLSAPVSESTVVRLTSSNRNAALVPTSITIPAGQVSGDFTISTRNVRNRTNVTITAAKTGGVASAQLTVDPTTVSAFGLSTYEVVGGNTLTGEIALSAPAPRGGAVVALTSSAPSVARAVRNWVLVPEGRTSATFTIRTFAVSDPRQVFFTASRGGISLRAGQSVEYPNGRPLVVRRAGLSGFTLSAHEIGSGGTVTGTVTLSGPAPARGSVVLLSADPSSAVSLPSTVVVRAGQRTATFTITAGSVAQVTEVVITATRFSDVEDVILRISP